MSRRHQDLLVKARGIAVLALHGAEAADRDAAQGIERFAALLFEKRGAHADGKFVDLHVQSLGRQEMAQLVNEDQKAEDQNCDQNIHSIT